MGAQHTPGPWRAEHMGGSSTVLCGHRPRHNDTGTPTYGYRDDGEHCIARPFTDDSGHLRRDFVCFSHDDARLIAAAPDLYEALRQAESFIVSFEGDELQDGIDGHLRTIRAALAKAERR